MGAQKDPSIRDDHPLHKAHLFGGEPVTLSFNRMINRSGEKGSSIKECTPLWTKRRLARGPKKGIIRKKNVAYS